MALFHCQRQQAAQDKAPSTPKHQPWVLLQGRATSDAPAGETSAPSSHCSLHQTQPCHHLSSWRGRRTTMK